MQILKQRFNYAKIELIRDNCLLEVGKQDEYVVVQPITEKTEDFFDDIFDDESNSLEIKPVIKNANFETIKLFKEIINNR
jgi:hypothetical protein